MMRRGGQTGVALISVLLIVVIATVLGVAMTREQNYAITRARLFLEQTRVHQYALGGEELARQILHADFKDAPLKDYLGEDWAQQNLQFEFEDGAVELRIEDLQGRFNLNSLVEHAGGNNMARLRFTNLLNQQGIDPAVADRLIDWLDSNQTVSALGAEDYDYLGLDKPYRTSGHALADASELSLLLDMDPASLARLMPLVTALPDPRATLNLNTAKPPVLQALVADLTPEVVDSLALSRQDKEGYDNVQTFLQDELLAGYRVPLEGIGVTSSFFQVSIRARYQGRFGYLTSIIQRDVSDGTLRVIYRDIGKKVYPFSSSDTSSDVANSEAVDD
ncbi:MAG: type II secretion system minor pseudopilin GspK [SAR86 cluster bacterium]